MNTGAPNHFAQKSDGPIMEYGNLCIVCHYIKDTTITTDIYMHSLQSLQMHLKQSKQDKDKLVGNGKV